MTVPILDEVAQFTKLLADFNRLGEGSQTEPTFLEISGYPHYENVCSNILAFFLDPGKEHGLKDLALAALLECSRETIRISNVSVEREVYTGNGRIDLVITADECIMAIENKIFHDVINDFADYRRYIEINANGRKIILLILGLHHIECRTLSGFISISYREYFAIIKKNIGGYLTSSNSKYLIFLLEFIQSIEHLIEGSAMNKELVAFFHDNLQATEAFITACDELRTEQRNKVNQLAEMVNVKAPDGVLKQWVYREPRRLFDTLVHDIKADYPIAIDCTITPAGWRMVIFDRYSGNLDKLKTLLKDIGIKYSMQEDRCWIDVHVAYDGQVETVAEKLTDIIVNILEKVSKPLSVEGKDGQA